MIALFTKVSGEPGPAHAQRETQASPAQAASQ
jgi:hypothetical protein